MPLLVHACLTPTRQAMMMMHVMERAVCGHAGKILETPTQVNRAARGMHRAETVNWSLSAMRIARRGACE